MVTISIPIFLILILWLIYWTSPFWLPVAFLAYAIQRKTVGTVFVVGAAVTEFLALWLTGWIGAWIDFVSAPYKG